MPNVPKWVADQMEHLLPSKFIDIEVAAIAQYKIELKRITFQADLSKAAAFPGSAINFREAIFYLTGNVTAIQRFRTILKKHDISSKHIKLQGYWAAGSVGL